MFACLKGCRLMGVCGVVWMVWVMLCGCGLFIEHWGISRIGLFGSLEHFGRFRNHYFVSISQYQFILIVGAFRINYRATIF